MNDVSVSIEVPSQSLLGLLDALKPVLTDLTSISLVTRAVEDDPPANEPSSKAQRRRAGRGRGHGRLVYLKGNGSGRKIAIEESLRRNGLTGDDLLAKPTRQGTWQNSLKLAMTISEAKLRANGGQTGQVQAMTAA